MRFYRPKLRLGVLLDRQSRLVSKLGGSPWGFPTARWPGCPTCQTPTTMVAQLEHAPPMIDLGPDGGVLHLFFCSNLGCLSYGDGLCQAVILRHDELGHEPTEPPRDSNGCQSIGGEAVIVDWEVCDDAADAGHAPSFYDDKAHMNLPDEIAHPFGFDPRFQTKAGGVPYWTGQGVTLDPALIPRPPFEFLLQVNQGVWIEGPPPSADQAGCDVVIQSPGGARPDWDYETPTGAGREGSPMSLIYTQGDDGYLADLVNFGSDGTGYVFIDRQARPAEVRWFWTR